MKIIRQARLYLSPYILIYQMGKVGSSSIYTSLKEKGVPKVFHLHRMNPEANERMKRTFLENNLVNQLHTEQHFEAIYKKAIQRKKKVKIITLVREPISRNISAFFENLPYKSDSSAYVNGVNIPELAERFMNEYPHNVPIDWFDHEMKVVTGIDVFSKEFDYSEKFQRYQNKNIQVLLMRTDLEDQRKASLIKRFLKIKDLQIARSNVAEKKDYGKVYEMFKRQICLPESYIDNMLQSKYATHFYSSKEIELIRKKWLRTHDT